MYERGRKISNTHLGPWVHWRNCESWAQCEKLQTGRQSRFAVYYLMVRYNGKLLYPKVILLTSRRRNSLDCFYCKYGQTSRCEKSLLFGCGKLDGGQAEYVSSWARVTGFFFAVGWLAKVRAPLADGTLFLAPPEIPEEIVVRKDSKTDYDWKYLF